LADLFSGNRAGELRGLSLDLAGGASLHKDLARHSADHQLRVYPELLSNPENDPLRFIFLKARRGDGDVIRAGAETADKIVTVIVGHGVPAKARRRIADRNRRPGDRCAGIVENSAGERAGRLCEKRQRSENNTEQSAHRPGP